jgi:teichuronic acid biosynthesis glycosyltransferase TuaC
MRVVMASHAYPTFSGGNAGEFVHGLASALVSLRHEVYAVIPWEPRIEESGSLMDGVHLEPYLARDRISYGNASNAYVRHPRLAVALSLFYALVKLYQVIKEQQVDIIHAHWVVPMGFVASLAKVVTGIPLVITMHGRDVYFKPEDGYIVPALWYVKPFLRFAFRQADRLVAVSQDCYNHARLAGAPAGKMQVIYNGTDLNRFFPSEDATNELRRRYRIATDAKLVLSVRSLLFRKGLDVLVRAMSRVLEVEPLALLLLVGEGPERENLTALRDGLGLQDKVLFAGHVPNAELAPYENACDLFVIPSRQESFGIAAIEAMACGKPVIGTAVGGLNEIIDDYRTGVLVEPDNIQQLADAIIRVLADKELAASLSRNALRKVEADYSWLNVASRMVDAYRQVLGSKRCAVVPGSH